MGGASIGTRIKRRREALGLTQLALAQRARLRQGHLSQIERGQRPHVRLDTVQRLAKALRLTLYELLDEA
jgi:transcriptional regulator with XRE-family HTH domain